MKLEEKKIDSTPIYDGVVIKVQRDTVELPNGGTSIRELVKHNGAVCVVPVTEDGMVYMVRQFRYAFSRIMLEIPAGKMDEGETPEQTAHRELEEEIGMTAQELIPMGAYIPSCAFLTERIFMFMAKGLIPSKQSLDEDEFLEIEKMPLKLLIDKIMRGEIEDGKTIASLLKVERMLNN